MSGLSKKAKALREIQQRKRWHRENESRSVKKMKKTLDQGTVIHGTMGESRRSKQALADIYVPPQSVKAQRPLLTGKNAQSTGPHTRKIAAYHPAKKKHVPHNEFQPTEYIKGTLRKPNAVQVDRVAGGHNLSEDLVDGQFYIKTDPATRKGPRKVIGVVHADKPERIPYVAPKREKNPEKVDAKFKRRQKAKAIQLPVLKKRLTLAEEEAIKVKIAEAKEKKSLVPKRKRTTGMKNSTVPKKHRGSDLFTYRKGTGTKVERKRTPPKAKKVIDRGLVNLRKKAVRSEMYANRLANKRAKRAKCALVLERKAQRLAAA
jgi:hypothetical protein